MTVIEQAPYLGWVVVPESANFTALPWIEYHVSTAGSTITVTLPPAVNGAEVTVKKVDSAGGSLQVTGTVDGTVNPTITHQWGTFHLRADGTQWYRPDRHTIGSLVDVADNGGIIPASYIPAASSGLVTIGGSPGAPTAGTFVAGNQYLDSVGVFYVCTASGTPGTWKCLPGQTLLSKQYEPGTLATYNVLGTTPTAIDATNLGGTFVAPPSGVVWMEQEAECQAITGGLVYYGVVDGSSVVYGSMGYVTTTAAIRGRYGRRVSGLTPGTTYTANFAACNSVGGDTARVFASSQTTPTNAGPAVLRVLSAV